MKKIVLTLASTVSVVVLLFGYHTSTAGSMASSSETSVVSGSAPAATESSGSASPSSGSSSSGSHSSSTKKSSVTGSVAQTQWGPVQVELSLTGSTITDVSVVQYPNGNGRDQEINSYALPILIQETIDNQSADIDMVSGATVTSGGYLESLQSALDQVSS